MQGIFRPRVNNFKSCHEEILAEAQKVRNARKGIFEFLTLLATFYTLLNVFHKVWLKCHCINRVNMVDSHNCSPEMFEWKYENR